MHINQRGFSAITVLIVLALLGIGFYAGLKFQQSPKNTQIPIISPTITPAPTIIPTSIPTFIPPTIAPTNPNLPTSIKILYPNGGENFKVGDKIHITWNSNNLNKSGSCIITLRYQDESKSAAWIPVNTSNGFYDWNLTSESGDRQAKIDMDCYDSSSNNAHDQSDAFFTILP